MKMGAENGVTENEKMGSYMVRPVKERGQTPFTLGMGKQGTFSLFAHAVESFFMRRFNAISSISHSMVNNAGFKTQHKTPTLLFPNWGKRGQTLIPLPVSQ